MKRWFFRVLAAILGMTDERLALLRRLGPFKYLKHKRLLRARIEQISTPGRHLLDFSTVSDSFRAPCIKCGRILSYAEALVTNEYGPGDTYACAGLNAKIKTDLFEKMMNEGRSLPETR